MKKITIELDCGDVNCEDCHFVISDSDRKEIGIFGLSFLYAGCERRGEIYRYYDRAEAEAEA